jgi:hypothetical protein
LVDINGGKNGITHLNGAIEYDIVATEVTSQLGGNNRIWHAVIVSGNTYLDSNVLVVGDFGQSSALEITKVKRPARHIMNTKCMMAIMEERDV